MKDVQVMLTGELYRIGAFAAQPGTFRTLADAALIEVTPTPRLASLV